MSYVASSAFTPALAVALSLLPSLARAQPQPQPQPAICGGGGVSPSSEGAAAVTVRKDLEYASMDGGRVLMDVYQPARSTQSGAPVVVFLNTSDFSQRAMPLYACWARAAVARGFVAITPDAYTKNLAAGFDALMAYLAAHAAELRIDAAQIGVYAASGNVGPAFPLIEDPARTAVKAAVVYYGSSEISRFRLDLPVLYVRAGLDRPEVNRRIDALVGLALTQNAPVTLLNYPGGHHAFEMVDDTEQTHEVVERTLDFLRHALSPPYQAALHARLVEASAAGAMASGDAPKAATMYASLVEARPDDPTLRLSYAEALLATREFAKARAQFEQLKGAPLGLRDLGVPAAKASALDGDPDGAIAWLRTIPKRFLPAALRDDPAFHALRDRADFQALFQQP